MTDDNLPPLPEIDRPAPKPSYTAYVLRGRDYVQVGTATPHPDGKGHQLRLDLATADGDVIELRALSTAHEPARPGRRKRHRRKFRP